MLDRVDGGRGGVVGAPRRRLTTVEAVRGFAATYVVVGHLPVMFGPSTEGMRWLLPLRFGQEAVTLFFIVSGLVIEHSMARAPEQGFRSYFVRRARRIYPVFIAGLILAYVATCLRHERWADPDWIGLLGNLAMLQDYRDAKPGGWFDAYQRSWPLWSLAYEWWFYMLYFPLRALVPERHRWWAACGLGLGGVVGYAAIPNGACLYLALLPLWWAGVEVAAEHRRSGAVTWAGQWRVLAGLTLMGLAWTATQYWARGGQLSSAGVTPVLQMRCYAAGVGLLAGYLAWRNHGGLRGFNLVFGPFAAVAPVSYAMYVLHWPLVIRANLLEAWPWPIRVATLVLALLALSWALEGPIQRWINRRTEGWATGREQRPAGKP